MELVRVASKADAQAVLDIYGPFCTDASAVSFETAVPAFADIEGRIEKTLQKWPWLVYELDGAVLGYAYAGEHKSRAAYDWSTDVSVYLHPEARGKGVGKRLYQCLFAILRELGYFNVYAGITLPNPASLGLHQSLGFEELAVYRNVGYKTGAWHDVTWLALRLREHILDPTKPYQFAKMDSLVLSKILDSP